MLNESNIGEFSFPLPTDSRGEFDQFIALNETAQGRIDSGAGTGSGVWRLDLLTNDTISKLYAFLTLLTVSWKRFCVLCARGRIDYCFRH